jgi:hypothetical protein
MPEKDPRREWQERHGAMLESLGRLEAWASAGIPAEAEEVAVTLYSDVADVVGAGLACMAALSGKSRADVADQLFKALHGEDSAARREELARRFRRQMEQGAEEGDDA